MSNLVHSAFSTSQVFLKIPISQILPWSNALRVYLLPMPWWLTNLVQWPLSKLTAWKSTKVCYKNTDSQSSPLKILIKYICFYFQSSLVIPVCSHVGKHWPKEYRPNLHIAYEVHHILDSINFSHLTFCHSLTLHFIQASQSLSVLCLIPGRHFPTEWYRESIPPSMSYPWLSPIQTYSVSFSWVPLTPCVYLQPLNS